MARKSKLKFEEHNLETKDKQSCEYQASTPKNGGEVKLFWYPFDPNVQQEVNTKIQETKITVTKI